MKKLLIIICLLAGLAVRLYKIKAPIADWHSHRQADTASVTQNLIRKTGTFFVPTYHDFSNIQTGKENPNGYRMVEIPIYNYFSSILAIFFPTDIASRLVSIIFSLGSSILVYLIVLSWTKNYWTALYSLAVFLFLPFNIYYSRTILPEPTAVFFMLLSLYLFKINFIISAISLALSILIKPYTALLLFPIFTFYTIQDKKYFQKLIFLLISFLPFALWRLWIKNFSIGIPASSWLFNEGNMRFHPAWWRWLFYERIGKLILGVFGSIPLYLGFALKKNKLQTHLILLLLGILIYFSVIARGNIQHDYYQILIIPFISIFVGIGSYYMFKFINPFSGIIVLLFSLAFSFYQIKDYYIYNTSIVVAGQKAKEILPANTWVIAPQNGNTSFLYQTGHSGWPIEIYDLEIVKNRYPNKRFYLVTVDNNDYTAKLKKTYSTIISNNDYSIIDLNEKK